MSIRYTKIKQKPTTFSRLVGISVKEFEHILEKLIPEWDKRITKNYKRPGRNFKLTLPDMLLMLIIYYRSYISQAFLGMLFGLDDSRVCRIIRTLEPILAKIVAIQKSRHLSKEEVESIIVDATEQQIERPSKRQKKFYSGKKKRHTNKTEIRITPKGRIVHVSKTRPGTIHDFTLYKLEPPIDPNSRAFVDSGYQGLDKIHRQTELPYKAKKKKKLDPDERQYNEGLSRLRVKVENVFCQIKTFKILSYTYRNKNKRYNLKFNIVAGLVNIKNGFAA